MRWAVVALLCAAPALAETWVLDDLERVHPDTPAGLASSLEIRGVRCGRVGIQVATRWPTAATLTLDASAPGLAVSIYAESYILGADGQEWADPLLPTPVIAARANTAYAWYVDAVVPCGLAPGNYAGSAAVTDGATVEAVTFTVEVLPIELPPELPHTHVNLARSWWGWNHGMDQSQHRQALTALRLSHGDIYYPYFDWDTAELQTLYDAGQRFFVFGKVDSVQSPEELRAFVDSVRALPDGVEILARSAWYGWDEKPQSVFATMAQVFGSLANEWPEIQAMTSAHLPTHWTYPMESMAAHSVDIQLVEQKFQVERDRAEVAAGGLDYWPYYSTIAVSSPDIRARAVGWVLTTRYADATLYYQTNGWGNPAVPLVTSEAPHILIPPAFDGTGQLIYLDPSGSAIYTWRIFQLAAGLEEQQLLEALAGRTSPEFAAELARPVADAIWTQDHGAVRAARDRLLDTLVEVWHIRPPSAYPEMFAPPPGLTLRDNRDAVRWDPGTEPSTVTGIEIGSTAGGVDIWTGTPAPGAVEIVPTWPVDGRDVYVTLQYRAWGLDRTTTASYVAHNDVSILEPVPGSVLLPGSVTYRWEAGRVAVDGWRLLVGAFDGDGSLYQGAALPPGQLSEEVALLPDDGRELVATLQFLAGGVWRSATATHTATQTPHLTAPDLAVPLLGSTATFEWSDAGLSPSAWYLYAGATPGGVEYYPGVNLPAGQRAETIAGLPVDGSAVWVRLWWHLVGTGWRWRDYQYTAATVPQITTPLGGAVVVGPASVPVAWVANGATVTGWQLDAGSAPGLSDLHSEALASATLQSSAQLPIGQAWIRLGWGSGSQEITVIVAAGPALTAPGSPITGPDTVFEWTAGGLADVALWYLSVGTVVGGGQIFSSGNLPASITSRTVTGLPAGTIFVRLWWQRSNSTAWAFTDYQMVVEG